MVSGTVDSEATAEIKRATAWWPIGGVYSDSGTLDCGNLTMGLVYGALLARQALTQICQC